MFNKYSNKLPNYIKTSLPIPITCHARSPPSPLTNWAHILVGGR